MLMDPSSVPSLGFKLYLGGLFESNGLLLSSCYASLLSLQSFQ
jgi:hypothetical protein